MFIRAQIVSVCWSHREVFERMVFRTIIHRDLKVARRLASLWIVLSVFAAWSVVPANADMIYMVEPVSAEQSALSINYPMTSTNWFFGACSTDSVVCGAPATRDETQSRPALPETPSEPLPSESPFVGLGIPAPSSGAGTDSGSSSNSGSSAAYVILCWVSDLPQLTVVGRLYAATAFDIPPAPPFELLRPPQVLTILV